MKSFIKSVLLIVIASSLYACSALNWYFQDSVAAPTGNVSLEGVKAPVTISRDDLGIPFIEAQNEDDLFFATGYATASDRLWQMFVMSMAAQGRLSEIVGQSMLDTDIFFRSMDIRSILENNMNELDARSIRSLQNFARGVTAYMKTHPDLPAEFRLTGFKPTEWTLEDSLFALCLFCFSVSDNAFGELSYLEYAGKVGWEKAAWLFFSTPDEPVQTGVARKLQSIDIKDLFPDGSPAADAPIATLIDRIDAASNNWAVSGNKTASGKSIVANDPHLGLSIPGPWIVMHLKCPTYQAAGVTLPGMPFVALGYNGHIAWGATMVMADSQDLFIEKIKREGGKISYLYQGQWTPVTERRESFKIKGRKKPVEKTIIATVHGPVLNANLTQIEYFGRKLPSFAKYGIAFCGAREGFIGALKAFLYLGDAGSAAAARREMLQIRGAYFNLVYGDADNIGWQVTGAYPVRKNGTGMFPSPGWDGAYDWIGFVPMDALPHAENPEQGFLATANNKTVDDAYPYHLSNTWLSDVRVGRIREVLGATDKATVTSMRDLQLDRKSLFAGELQQLLFSEGFNPELYRAIGLLGDEHRIAQAREALAFLSPAKFNGVIAPESASAAVYEAFLFGFDKNFLFDEIGADYPYINRNADNILYRPDSPFWDNVKTKIVENRADVIAATLADAIDLCEDRLGADRSEWQWGKMHTYCFKNMAAASGAAELLLGGYMNTASYPAGGDWDTLNLGGYLLGKSFDVIHIPSMRMVVDFGSEEPACLVAVPGQSGNPFSPHYADMVPYFLKGANHPLPFREANIRKQYTDVLIIKPQGS